MPLGPTDSVPQPCPLCEHLAMLHTRTSSGKRCIGNQWRCRCGERPLSMVIVLPRLGQTPSVEPEDAADDYLKKSIESGEYV